MKTTTNPMRSLFSALSIYQNGKLSLRHVWTYILLLLPIYEYAVISAFKSVKYPVVHHEAIAVLAIYTPLLYTVMPYLLGWFELALDKLNTVSKYLLCAVCAFPLAIMLTGILHLIGRTDFEWEGIGISTLFFAPLLMVYGYRRKAIGDLTLRRQFGLKRYSSIHASASFNKKAGLLTKSEARDFTKQIFELVTGQAKPKDNYIEISSHLVTKGFHRRLKEKFKGSTEWEVSDLEPNSVLISHIQIFLISVSSNKGLTYRRGNTVRIVRKPQIANTQVQQQ